jgi:hypothetical protein
MISLELLSGVGLLFFFLSFVINKVLFKELLVSVVANYHTLSLVGDSAFETDVGAC